MTRILSETAPPLLAALLLMLITPSFAADVPGASDPVRFERYPQSRIISYSADAEPQAHEFIVSHVEKIRRELKVGEQVRVNARDIRAIYEAPAGAPLDEVIRHYLRILPTDDVLFSCRGRDCGRSAQWANQVFGEAGLYGPDAGQFYLAGKRAEGLVSVYVIERGNRRINVLVRLLVTADDVAVQSGSRLVEMLGSNGHVIVTGVLPNVDGTLPARAKGVLDSIRPHLEKLREAEVYVVCHLYAPGDTRGVIKRSQACAEQVITQLGLTAGPELVAFGAGPLLPRTDRVGRIELVLPHRRARE
jgi:hypothetical protein